jgi:curli production assembly/transport component CsgG
MTEQLKRKMAYLFVVKLRNRPTITGITCFDLDNFLSQSARNVLKHASLIVISIIFSITLSSCTAMPGADHLLGPKLERKDWDKVSEVHYDLISLPQPRGKMVASVYNFRDLTGQYKPAPSSSFSTAVSQGAASMLIKAIKDSGWFSPLEREGLQDLLTERKIIRAALKKQQPNQDMPPLLGANILIEGGIIGYETNMKTGGAGAKYFGIGMSEQYRVDQVTVNLRVVDVNSGRIINSVTTNKSILSRSVQGGVFRFVRFKRLLEIEAGYTRNEPVQLCLLEAIQATVIRIIVEGVQDKSWSLANQNESNHPLLSKYGRAASPAPPLAIKKTTQSPVNNTHSLKAIKNNTIRPAANGSAKGGSVPTSDTTDKNSQLAKINRPENIKASAIVTKKIKKNKKVIRKEKKILALANNFSRLALNKDPEKDNEGPYVIQLMSSTSSMEIIEFVRVNNISRDMIEYIRYKAKDKDRFAILYGSYRNKTRAIQAIESLPTKLRIYEPWVRLASNR